MQCATQLHKSRALTKNPRRKLARTFKNCNLKITNIERFWWSPKQAEGDAVYESPCLPPNEYGASQPPYVISSDPWQTLSQNIKVGNWKSEQRNFRCAIAVLSILGDVHCKYICLHEFTVLHTKGACLFLEILGEVWLAVLRYPVHYLRLPVQLPQKLGHCSWCIQWRHC